MQVMKVETSGIYEYPRGLFLNEDASLFHSLSNIETRYEGGNIADAISGLSNGIERVQILKIRDRKKLQPTMYVFFCFLNYTLLDNLFLYVYAIMCRIRPCNNQMENV